MSLTLVEGGVTSPQGFKAGGIHAGIRRNASRKDLSMIYAETDCSAAAVYTQNLVQGAPITVTKKHLQDGRARAVICNSGNANTCNADGEYVAEEMCRSVADALGIRAEEVIVASTGVIGQPLPLDVIRAGIPVLAASLSPTMSGGKDAALAIMTTDLIPKAAAVTFELNGRSCTVGGMTKGSGMIHPNMATMLAFLTTDVAISPEMLNKALRLSVEDSYNMISIDGDTSTNDMCCILANGQAGNDLIVEQGEEFQAFAQALLVLNTHLARLMAKDGEGATKLITIDVSGAKTTADAKRVARTVSMSSLLKAAIFGSDANWGRVLCAIGYAGVDLDIHGVDVCFSSRAGRVDVCKSGMGISFDEGQAKSILDEDEIVISIALREGEARATAWGCDLTYDYVKINGSYRT